jgi:hypothetical protein
VAVAVPGTFQPTTIYARVLSAYRERAASLWAIGAAVYVPIGFLESVVEIQTHDRNAIVVAAVVVVALATSATTLLGDVFYSGAVAGLVAHPGSSLRSVARTLPYLRLIVVDLLFGIGVSLGVLLVVAPGVVLFTWFALAGVLVEIEGVGIRAAFRRSRRLVRGRFWRVLVVVGPITVATEAVAEAAEAAGHSLLGGSAVAEWLAGAAANVVLSPVYALAAVLTTLELIRLGEHRTAARR